MNVTKKMTNIIKFPGKNNKKVDEQEDMIYKNANKINDLMLAPNWDTVEIDEDLLSIICEFGEYLPITTLASHRLNSLLAASILMQGANNDNN